MRLSPRAVVLRAVAVVWVGLNLTGEVIGEAGARPALTAVLQGPGPDSYTLVCQGHFEHRLVEDKDRLLVVVELPGTKSAMLVESLPPPRGLVNAIAIGGGGEDSARVVFALSRPASAAVSVNEHGIELRLEALPPGIAPTHLPAEAWIPPSSAAASDGPRPAGEAWVSEGDAHPPAPAVSLTARVTDSAADPDLLGSTKAVPEMQAGALSPGADLLMLERPLGTEDLLEISVFEIPELSRTVRVSENGMISLPLLGEVKAEGLTPRRLEIDLRERLGRTYLQNPQVSVFIRENGSKKVSVLGAVGKPGAYEMLGPRTLLQVLSQAGGLTPGVGAELYVLRSRPGGSNDRIAVNVNDLLMKDDAALNLTIEPGDIISVPPDRPVYIYVDGAVKTPGRIEQLASRPITLLQAIAKAGGATERANLKAIQILRQSPDGTQTSLQVNLKHVRRGKEPDPILGEGDVVVVPEAFF